MSARLTAAVSLATLSLATSAHAFAYNYFDTTFVNSDWIGVKYADTSAPAASFTAAQQTSGGSAILPGPQTPNYREISHTFGGGGAIIVSHQGVNYNWTPVPLETATTVDYSYDLRFFSTLNDGAVGFSPAIFQGGNVYRLAYDNVFNPTSALDPVGPGWQRFTASGVPISSFVRIDPATAGVLPGTPIAAAAMSFGFVSANSANQINYVKVSGVDDFGLTLNTVRVPEPASLTALAGVGMMLGRRRRV